MNTLTEHEMAQISGGSGGEDEIMKWIKSNTLEWIYSIMGRAAR